MKLTKGHESHCFQKWEGVLKEEAKSGDLPVYLLPLGGGRSCRPRAILWIALPRFPSPGKRGFLFPEPQRSRKQKRQRTGLSLKEKEEKTVKKILSLILVTILAVSMAACGSSGSQSAAEEPAKESSAEAAATEAPAAESTEPAETEAPAAESSEAEAEPAEAAEPFVTITDMTGREISLDEPATRIVALSAADCEVLYAIGGGDALVGRGEYCDYPAEVLDVPSVQSGYDTNIEQIISLEPQVLLMSTMAQTEEQIAALEAAGIRVVVSDAQDIEGVYTSIDMIGKLMGKEDNAKAVIDGMKSTFDGLKANAGDGTKTVYFEVSPLEYGLWTAGKNTFMNEISEMIGLKNVFDDVDGWAEISEEQVIERNPDYIVTITMYFGEGPTPVEEILSRPGWGEITAVKNEAVLNLVNNELSRPTPRLAEGAQMLYDFVYAEEALDNAA